MQPSKMPRSQRVLPAHLSSLWCRPALWLQARRGTAAAPQADHGPTVAIAAVKQSNPRRQCFRQLVAILDCRFSSQTYK